MVICAALISHNGIQLFIFECIFSVRFAYWVDKQVLIHGLSIRPISDFYWGKLKSHNTSTKLRRVATGKSTFIKILEEASSIEDWEITPEPVSTWTQIEGQNVSLFQIGACNIPSL